jgi:hypothetical protein
VASRGATLEVSISSAGVMSLSSKELARLGLANKVPSTGNGKVEFH